MLGEEETRGRAGVWGKGKRLNAKKRAKGKRQKAVTAGWQQAENEAGQEWAGMGRNEAGMGLRVERAWADGGEGERDGSSKGAGGR